MEYHLVALTNQSAGCGKAQAIGGTSDEDARNWSILSKLLVD